MSNLNISTTALETASTFALIELVLFMLEHSVKIAFQIIHIMSHLKNIQSFWCSFWAIPTALSNFIFHD